MGCLCPAPVNTGTVATLLSTPPLSLGRPRPPHLSAVLLRGRRRTYVGSTPRGGSAPTPSAQHPLPPPPTRQCLRVRGKKARSGSCYSEYALQNIPAAAASYSSPSAFRAAPRWSHVKALGFHTSQRLPPAQRGAEGFDHRGPARRQTPASCRSPHHPTTWPPG